MAFKKLSILAVSIFFLHSYARAAADFCGENGKVYVPVVDFVRGNQHIIFVGMVHSGTKAYYERVSGKLQELVDQAPAAKTVTLTEFFTCEKGALNIKSGTVVPPTEIQGLSHVYNTNTLNPFFQAATQIEACELDVDGKTLRPSYLAQRNKRSCKRQHDAGLACQFEDLKLPAGQRSTVASGDYVIDKQPLVTQLIGSMSYGPIWKFADDSQENENLFNNLFLLLMLEQRSDLIGHNAIKALQTYDRVILPWGSGHGSWLEPLLIANGFKVQSRSGILYTGLSDLGISKNFDDTIKSFLYEGQVMAGHCQ